MPRTKPNTTVQRRTRAQLTAHRATLVPKTCACGHTAIEADEYYGGTRGGVCVDCYRATEAERQRSYRMLTPSDIRNPARQSGYNHVSMHRTGTPYYGISDGSGHRAAGRVPWRGPRRATAEEAAQDYCDYINGQKAVTPVQLKSAGHEGARDRLPKDPEIQAALGVLRDAKGQREGRQGYVYLISDGTAYKVGYSTNPWARVPELQTGNPRKLSLVSIFKGTVEDERALHIKYSADNILQEWFEASPALRAEFKDKKEAAA